MPRECLRTPADLTVLELLFGSDAMLLIGRLLIVAAAVVMLASTLFVLGSIAVRVRRGHWLKRAGPFEVSDTTAGKVGRETEALERTIDAQRTRIAVLESLLTSGASHSARTMKEIANMQVEMADAQDIDDVRQWTFDALVAQTREVLSTSEEFRDHVDRTVAESMSKIRMLLQIPRD